VEKNLKVIGKS